MRHHVVRVGTPKRPTWQWPDGSAVHEAKVLEHVSHMAIPPAWQQVQAAVRPGARIWATGYDAAGRKQYLYNPRFRELQELKKFDHIVEFANSLSEMRRVTGQHLRHRKLDRNKVLACMTRLIDQAYFRVGSERYARENQTFGLATMRSRHLTVKGDTLIFEYVGKSHKVNHREVEDPTLAKIVSQLDDLPGYEIFKYYDEQGELVAVTSDDLNAYIKEIMGQDFSAKDFRTWAGTLIAAVALAEAEKVDSKAAQKRTVTAAIAEVAERLGNTPAIAKASYVDPRIVNHYLKGHTIAGYLTQIEHELGSTSDMSLEEYAVLQLLQHRLRHPKKA